MTGFSHYTVDYILSHCLVYCHLLCRLVFKLKSLFHWIYVVQSQAHLEYMVNNLEYIFNKINREVEMKTSNGSWVSTVYLPNGLSVPVGSKFQVSYGYVWPPISPITVRSLNGDSSWGTKYVYNNQNLVFVVVNSVWLTKYDQCLAHADI